MPLMFPIGFSQEDSELFWEALRNMFKNDCSTIWSLLNAVHAFSLELVSPGPYWAIDIVVGGKSFVLRG
jgi:hypothetical protein